MAALSIFKIERQELGVRSSPEGSWIYLSGVALIAALGGLLFGFDTAVISGTVGFLERQYGLSPALLGWVVSSALVGCIAGAGIAGILSDRFGRRAALIISAALFFVLGIGCTFAWSPGALAAARLFGGVGIGMASTLSPLYIAEFSPPHLRGRLVALYQFAITAGILAAYLSNTVLLEIATRGAGALNGHSWLRHILVEEPWRAMLGSEAIPAMVFLALIFAAPESPRWLVEHGASAKALKILARISGSSVAGEQMREIEETIKMGKGSLGQLLEPRWRRALLIGIVLALAGQLSGINCIIYYGPKIFEQAGLTLGSSFGGSVATGVILCLATLIAIWKVDTIGRRPLLLWGMAGCVGALFFTGVFFHFHVTSGLCLLVLVSTFLAFFAFSLGSVPWIVISEIFPTDIRGRAMSISTVVLWIACAAVSQTFPWLLKAIEPAGVFWLYGGFTFLSLVAAWVLVPETKGKSLEQIERQWLTPDA